jgi:hypothetical protein
VALDQGHTAEARSFYEAAVPLGERLGDRRQVAQTCAALARLASSAGDGMLAAATWRRALTLIRDLGGNRARLAMFLSGIARLLSTGDQAAVAVRLLDATDTDADWWDTGYMGRIYARFREDHAVALRAAQATLREAAFAQAWAAGQALGPDAAVELALTAAAELARDGAEG